MNYLCFYRDPHNTPCCSLALEPANLPDYMYVTFVPYVHVCVCLCSEIMSSWHAIFRMSTEASTHLCNPLFRGVVFRRHRGRGMLSGMSLSCWKVVTRRGVCQADRMSLPVSETILWRRTSRQNWLQLLVCLSVCLLTSVCYYCSCWVIHFYLCVQYFCSTLHLRITYSELNSYWARNEFN